MDLNIGTAFWFASRGVGYIRKYAAKDIEMAFAAKDNMVNI
jgi:hypothetical protein